MNGNANSDRKTKSRLCSAPFREASFVSASSDQASKSANTPTERSSPQVASELLVDALGNLVVRQTLCKCKHSREHKLENIFRTQGQNDKLPNLTAHERDNATRNYIVQSQAGRSNKSTQTQFAIRDLKLQIGSNLVFFLLAVEDDTQQPRRSILHRKVLIRNLVADRAEHEERTQFGIRRRTENSASERQEAKRNVAAGDGSLRLQRTFQFHSCDCEASPFMGAAGLHQRQSKTRFRMHTSHRSMGEIVTSK